MRQVRAWSAASLAQCRAPWAMLWQVCAQNDLLIFLLLSHSESSVELCEPPSWL